MTLSGDPGDRFFRSIDPFAQPVDSDGELAYQLQNSKKGDPQIQILLIERFGADLQRLVRGWLALEMLPAEAEDVRPLVVDILIAAEQQIAHVRGEVSLRNWTYRLALEKLKRYVRRNLRGEKT